MKQKSIFYKLYVHLKIFFFIFSILKGGPIAPIVCSKEGIILDGNTRFRIAKKMGLKTIKGIRIDAAIEDIPLDEIVEGY
jgi:ParB-like chromosome segregation protein Spo0J